MRGCRPSVLHPPCLHAERDGSAVADSLRHGENPSADPCPDQCGRELGDVPIAVQYVHFHGTVEVMQQGATRDIVDMCAVSAWPRSRGAVRVALDGPRQTSCGSSDAQGLSTPPYLPFASR